jgi:hypothetical protein
MRLRMQTALLLALVAMSAQTLALKAYVTCNYTWPRNGHPLGTWLLNTETGDTTRIYRDLSDPPHFSPDGREVAGLLDNELVIMNNDGTNVRTLVRSSDFAINAGLYRSIAFGPNGIYWVQTNSGNTSKILMFCDRRTGQRQQLCDLSSHGDGMVQSFFVSNDGLRMVSWLHSETVTATFATLLGAPVVRSMGVWGHGPVLTADGGHVLISACSANYDLGAGNPAHRTWVVYDYASGSLANFQDRFVSPCSDYTAINGIVPVRNNDSLIGFSSEAVADQGPVTGYHIMNWRTHQLVCSIPASQLPGGAGEVWLGVLPNPHDTTPAIGLDKSSLQFVTVSGNPAAQNVTVTNLGSGTLGVVSAATSPAAAWLTVTRTGNGNSQSLQNSINVTGLADGVYQTTVTVSAANSSLAPTYAVQLTVGSSLNAPTSLTSGVLYSGSEIVLTWQDNTSTESGFVVQRSIAQTPFVEIARVPANMVTYTDTGLAAGSYRYRVLAYDATSSSAPSDTTSQTLSGNPRFAITSPVPGDTLVAGTQVHVRWSSEIVQLVEVRLSTNGGDTWITLNATGGIGTNDPAWGDFVFTVPNAPSADAIIRVQRYGDPATAVEAASLVIVPGAADVATRAGAVILRTALQNSARFTSSGATPVNLSYSLAPGDRAACASTALTAVL